MKGLSLDAVNDINKSLYNIYREYPQLEFFVQKVSTKNTDSVASFSTMYNKGKVTTELRMNPSYFENVQETIKENVDRGFWTPKDGIEGIIRHEMGHALEVHRTFMEYGVNPFKTDINSMVDRYQAMKQSIDGVVSYRIVCQAFSNLDMVVNKESLSKHVSKYAAVDFEKTGRLKEAFAEILSDNRHGELYNVIKKIIKGGWKSC